MTSLILFLRVWPPHFVGFTMEYLQQEIGAAYKQAMRLAYQHDASWWLMNGWLVELGEIVEWEMLTYLASWLDIATCKLQKWYDMIIWYIMILPSSHSITDYEIYIWRWVAGIHPGPPRWFLHDYGPEQWNKSPWKGWMNLMNLSFGTVWMFSNCRLQFITLLFFWGGGWNNAHGHFDGVFPSFLCICLGW